VSLLYEGGPLHLAEIGRRLPASRQTLGETLEKLQAAGAVEQRAAGGRTTFGLTPAGSAMGSACGPVVEAIRGTDVLPIALKKWPMIVLAAIGRGTCHYNELKGVLDGITSRALTAALRDLQAHGLVQRTVDEGYPPTTEYRLTARGGELFPVVDALCRACAAAAGEE